MKKYILFCLFFLSHPIWASPLDLVYDTPGSFWGRADTSPDAKENLTHVQFQFEQGMRFQHVKWLTFYGAFTLWQQTGVSRSNFYSYGIKNTTWFNPFVVGIEEQQYVFNGETPTLDSHLIVGYISVYQEWSHKE